MLSDFLRKAVSLGLSELEIDSKHGETLVCAMCGPMGVGIGSARRDTGEAVQLFEDLDSLKRAKRVVLDGHTFSVKVIEFDSFGQTAYRLQLKKAK